MIIRDFYFKLFGSLKYFYYLCLINKLTMKKINYFFDKMAYWKVWLITTIIIGALIVALIMPVLDHVTTVRGIVGSAIIGGLFGLFVMALTYQGRQSIIFWAAAGSLNDKITNVKTREELKLLIEEYNSTRKLGAGEPHWSELSRIRVRLEDKIQHLNELETLKK